MVLVLTAPILPGRDEAWRRMCQELLGSRAERFAASARRLGVLSLRMQMVPTARGELVVVQLDMAHAGAALAELALSEAPFDRWLLRQIQQLLGVDLLALAATCGEPVLEWVEKEARS